MSPHPDEHYLEAIRKGDRSVLKRLIEEYYPPVESWVCQNSGTPADAEDVFGNALEAIFKKLSEDENFALSARLSTYIFSICKNQWRNRLRRKRRAGMVRLDLPEVLNKEDDSWRNALEETERRQFFRKKLSQLPESCRRLLQLCWSDDKKTMEEIAALMGYASAGYASKRKCQCIAQLIKMIREDPEFEEYG